MLRTSANARHHICLRAIRRAFLKNSPAVSSSKRTNNMRRDTAAGNRSSAIEENVQTIKRWESAILRSRSKAEQMSDWIAFTAGTGKVLVLHVLWFSLWVTVNLGLLGGIEPFDPFPFPFLTMTVSLEAIFLALFVLASQNRLAHQADKRSHLDLQIDLLAEREMTAVLQMLQDIAQHLDVKTTMSSEQLGDLMKKTDLHRLTDRMEELAEPKDSKKAAASSQR